MFTVKIMSEFIHSPIWVYDEDIVIDEPSVIANDTELQDLCNQAENLFSSYYKFNSNNQPCLFDNEREKKEKDIMLSLISRIKKRLNEINDGSFIIEDLETCRLKEL